MLSSSNKGKKEKPFEESLAEVEQVVKQLEEGNTSLEEAVELYSKGTEALQQCYHILDTLEKKVEVITKNAEGAIHTEPLE